VHVKAFEHGKLAMNTVKEVCDRNYQLKTPYVPNAPSFPATRFTFWKRWPMISD